MSLSSLDLINIGLLSTDFLPSYLGDETGMDFDYLIHA